MLVQTKRKLRFQDSQETNNKDVVGMRDDFGRSGVSLGMKCSFTWYEGIGLGNSDSIS